MSEPTCPAGHCLLQHEDANADLTAELVLAALAGGQAWEVAGDAFVPIEPEGVCRLCVRLVMHGSAPLPTTDALQHSERVSRWHWRRDHRRRVRKHLI